MPYTSEYWSSVPHLDTCICDDCLLDYARAARTVFREEWGNLGIAGEVALAEDIRHICRTEPKFSIPSMAAIELRRRIGGSMAVHGYVRSLLNISHQGA